MGEANVICEVNKPILTSADQHDGHLISNVERSTTRVVHTPDGKLKAVPETFTYEFKTKLTVPRTGLLVAGLGGNNGSTLAAGMIANKRSIQWETNTGSHSANWLGSVAMMGTVKLGLNENLKDVYVPIRSLLPMLHPDDLAIGGWDISGMPLATAMRRAQVLPLEVQHQVEAAMAGIEIMPGVYDKDFIATNQEIRADHVINGTKSEQLSELRKQISGFKAKNELEKVIVLWSGNTERFSIHTHGIHDSSSNLLNAVKENHSEIAPSLLYAMAAVLEGCSFINGSPQNTICEGLVSLATEQGVYLVGDDLKTGQTKFKSVMADFLVSTALKPTSIVSYNHLGNNDGLNLSSEKQFRSKEISKASVVDDMIASNSLLYPEGAAHPDHLIVIKYVPAVGDSKRALDEYTAKIFMDGNQTFVLHNTCEDSLLAVPIILDLVIFTELVERIQVRRTGESHRLDTLLSILSPFCKAPRVPRHAPVVNALFQQKEALIDFIKAAAGLPVTDYLSMPHRVSQA